MLSKRSICFSVLLLFSLSTFLNIKGSEQPNEEKLSLFPILTTNERDEVIERFLSNYEQVASEELRQDIVKATEGYGYIGVCDFMDMIEETSETSSFEETCRKVLTIDERAKIIKKILSFYSTYLKRLQEIINELDDDRKKSTTEPLMQDIIKLTKGYNILQISTLVFDMAEKWQVDLLDQFESLKLAQMDEVIERFKKINFEQEKDIFKSFSGTEY